MLQDHRTKTSFKSFFVWRSPLSETVVLHRGSSIIFSGQHGNPVYSSFTKAPQRRGVGIRNLQSGTTMISRNGHQLIMEHLAFPGFCWKMLTAFILEAIPWKSATPLLLVGPEDGKWEILGKMSSIAHFFGGIRIAIPALIFRWWYPENIVEVFFYLRLEVVGWSDPRKYGFLVFFSDCLKIKASLPRKIGRRCFRREGLTSLPSIHISGAQGG